MAFTLPLGAISVAAPTGDRDMPKVIIKLLKQWGSHNPGEVAGFAPHVATKLIDQGFAKLLHEPEPAEVGDESAEAAQGSEPADDKQAAAPKKPSTKKST